MITTEGNIRVSDADIEAMATREVTPAEVSAAEARLKAFGKRLRSKRSQQPALSREELMKQASEGADSPEEIARIRASVKQL